MGCCTAVIGRVFSEVRSMNVFSYIHFTPCSLPLELVKALPSQQRVLHRLVYRCSSVLEHDGGHSATTKFIQVEVPLIDHKQAQHSLGLSDQSIFTNAVFWRGTSANVDLLMPDRYGPNCNSWCHPNIRTSVTWTSASTSWI